METFHEIIRFIGGGLALICVIGLVYAGIEFIINGFKDE